MKNIFNIKTLLFLGIIIASGYLVSKYPDYSILTIGIAIILVIGIWLLQVERDNN